jgi:diguanylate cyclase (GGDEF)-like protein
MNSIADFLAHVPIFSGLEHGELEALAVFLEPRRYAAGSIVFSEGEKGAEMFVVRSGEIESYMPTSGGKQRILTVFKSGGLFGEMAIVEGEPRSASCRAKADSELLAFQAIDFYRFIWEHPLAGSRLLKKMTSVMVGRLIRASGFLLDMATWGETARRRAITDDLSGLFNRRFLEEASRLRFGGVGAVRSSSLLFLDLDNFHALNERYGSEAGDAIIVLVSAMIRRVVRENDIAARLSGDEFAILLPGTGRADALALAETLRAETAALAFEFRSVADSPDESARVTVSIGEATYPEDASTQAALFEAADRALFGAKKTGRNSVCAFNEVKG